MKIKSFVLFKLRMSLSLCVVHISRQLVGHIGQKWYIISLSHCNAWFDPTISVCFRMSICLSVECMASKLVLKIVSYFLRQLMLLLLANEFPNFVQMSPEYSYWGYHGALAIYAKLRVAHALRMPGTFSDHYGLAIPVCIMARVWCTCRDACRVR